MAIKLRWILFAAGLSSALLLGWNWQMARPPVQEETAWLQQLYAEHTALTKGGPVVVNFWASWCAPCRREMPMLSELHRQGVPIIGFSLDEDLFLAQEFLLQHPTDFDHVFNRSPQAQTIRIYPTTLILDGKGQPIFVHEGEITREELDSAWQTYNNGEIAQ